MWPDLWKPGLLRILLNWIMNKNVGVVYAFANLIFDQPFVFNGLQLESRSWYGYQTSWRCSEYIIEMIYQARAF